MYRRQAAQSQPYRQKRPRAIVEAQREREAVEARTHYGFSDLPLDDDTRKRIILTVEAGARFDAERGERRELKDEQALFQAEYDAAYAARTT